MRSEQIARRPDTFCNEGCQIGEGRYPVIGDLIYHDDRFPKIHEHIKFTPLGCGRFMIRWWYEAAIPIGWTLQRIKDEFYSLPEYCI